MALTIALLVFKCDPQLKALAGCTLGSQIVLKAGTTYGDDVGRSRIEKAPFCKPEGLSLWVFRVFISVGAQTLEPRWGEFLVSLKCKQVVIAVSIEHEEDLRLDCKWAPNGSLIGSGGVLLQPDSEVGLAKVEVIVVRGDIMVSLG